MYSALSWSMATLTPDHSTEYIRAVVFTQSVHSQKSFLTFSQEGWNGSVFDQIPSLPKQIQKGFKGCGFLGQGIVNGGADSFSVGGFLLVTEPLVIALALPGWILNDRITILDADGIAEPADCLGAAPEDPELN